jgi:hypothetical protein
MATGTQFSEDSSPETEPEFMAEQDRHHAPLSAAAYIKKFGYVDYDEGNRVVGELEKIPLVPPEAFVLFVAQYKVPQLCKRELTCLGVGRG